MNADEFKTLVSGGVVKKNLKWVDHVNNVVRRVNGVEIILQDIGFEAMLDAVREAVDEWVSDYPDP